MREGAGERCRTSKPYYADRELVKARRCPEAPRCTCPSSTWTRSNKAVRRGCDREKDPVCVRFLCGAYRSPCRMGGESQNVTRRDGRVARTACLRATAVL